LLTNNYTHLISNTVAQAAKLGHFQGVLYTDNADNILIWGNGVLDGNWAKQYDVYGVGREGAGGIASEYFGQCIGLVKSSNVTVRGISETKKLQTINGGVCGIASYRRDNLFSENILIHNVHSHHNHDKNLLFGYINHSTISNYEGRNAVFEDGLICYLHCNNITVNNAILTDNNRQGLSWNSDYNDTLIATNITTSGNEYGFYVSSHYVVADSLFIEDNIALLATYSPREITINNAIINNSTDDYQLMMYGDVQGATFNNLTISNCTGTAAIRVLSNYGSPVTCPTNIVFNGGGIINYTGTHTDIESGCENNIDFNDFDL